MLGTPNKFSRHGKCGAELSELLPHLARVVDDIAIVKSMHTDQFNHAPAQLMVHTGSQFQGRPSMGSWVTYGLGSENADLPGFVVLTSGGVGPDGGTGLWSNGFLPGEYQGTHFRSQGDPWGWDNHGTSKDGDIITGLSKRCAETDKASAALISDLKQRGLLDDTLVVWGGEFGRTPMNEARNGSKFLGRDHHPKAFTIWMAGGGIKGGVTLGATDELGYNVVQDPVHVHDLQATILQCLGLDHKRLTYRFQGRDFRLTDVQGDVVR